MAQHFTGIFAALTTPFEEGTPSFQIFRNNIQKYNTYELAGYLVLGSTGESVHLSDDESEKLVQTAKESTSPDKILLVGTARESTQLTIRFTNRMADYGADAALIRTPGYFKSRMSREALKTHYLSIADQSRLPVILYNIPQYTGVTLAPDLVIELSRHPKIAGIKDSSGNLTLLTEALPELAPDFSFLLGAGGIFLPGLCLGANGGILTLADVFPGLCVRLYNLFKEGKIEDAQKLQLKLVPLNQAVTQTYGVPGAKYAMDLIGYHGGFPRLPLLPLNEQEKREIEKLIKEFKQEDFPQKTN